MSAVIVDSFDPTHPHALAMYCSDGRFTRAVEELLLRGLGHRRLDVLAVPGGPALLTQSWATRFYEIDTIQRGLFFLLSSHGIKQIVLIAHQGCGYYRSHYPQLPQAELMETQREDLRRAAKAVLKRDSTVSISLYYARVVDNSVHFDNVAPGGSGL